MLHVELISNQSVQDDIVELMEAEIKNFEYTIIPNVQGSGLSSKKLGTTVWPEMNFYLLSYTDDSQLNTLKSIVEKIKKKFPKEGISCFITKVELI